MQQVEDQQHLSNPHVDKAHFDVLIIGAGPAGSVAACLLRQRGYTVKILEKSVFPRFSIGESLLPQCLQTLQQAGCLEAVQAAGFQLKTGATFQHRGHYENIDFNHKSSPGPSTAFHVERAEFDQVLANCASQAGAEIIFAAEVVEVQNKIDQCVTTYHNETGETQRVTSRFILDASGYGRVLPRLLGIDKPSTLAPKASLFTHIEDHMSLEQFNRETTLITTHPEHRDVWFWLICFKGGRSSVGVVGPPDKIEPYQAAGIDGLKAIINEDPVLCELLSAAVYDKPASQLNAYSGNVTQFYGDGYAVLGNAGEFLDPIFSSGVTVAMQSSKLAVDALDSSLKGQSVDWQAAFEAPLKTGIETFKTFVTNWYSGGFQDVIYSPRSNQTVKAKIAAILAGYAWDLENPYVKDPQSRLNTLMEICRP